jgi:hypothetical protein
VISVNAHGNTGSAPPPARFSVNPALKPIPVELPQVGPDGLIARADLRGTIEPVLGKLVRTAQFQAAEGVNGTAGQAVQLDGKSQKLVYEIGEFPEEDYSVAVWVRIDQMPSGRTAQVFSAWCASMDDPLRVCVEDGKLSARIEAGHTYVTPRVAIEPGRWHHVAAVKAGDTLRLFLDGKPGSTATAPVFHHSGATEVALGGNPRYPGNEYLAGTFADFRLYARALQSQEIFDAANQK